MAMPPALAAALAAKSGGKKKGGFGKKPGNAAEDALDGGRDDAMEGPMVAAARAKLAAPKPGAKKKGNLPPWLAKK